MQHGHHGCTGVRAAGQAAQQGALVRGVQVRGGLVQQQHGCFNGQGARQQHTLAFTARQFIQAPMGIGRALGLGHGAVDRRFIVGIGRAKQPVARQAAQPHRVARGDVTFGFALLRQPGQLLRPRPCGPVAHRAALQLHLAGVGLAQRRQQRQQGALAGAIGADDRRPGAGLKSY